VGSTAGSKSKASLAGPGRLMLFEAFVTDQRKTTDTRHIEDAHLAQLPHFQKFFGAFLGVIAREAAILLDRYPKNANYSHELYVLCSCRNWMYKLYRHACSSSEPPSDSRARPTSIISWWSRWLRIKAPVIG